MRIRVRTTEQIIARRVQYRLRSGDIHVHNLLVRVIVSHIMDILSGMTPFMARAVLEEWVQGRNQTTAKRWKRLIPKLAIAYSLRIMQERGLRLWAVLLQRRRAEVLTSEEYLVLVEMRRALVESGHSVAAEAIRKSMESLAPWNVVEVPANRKNMRSS